MASSPSLRPRQVAVASRKPYAVTWPAMMFVERTVGRLCEVRYVDPLTPDELTDFTLAIRNLVASADAPLVFCCDWRAVSRFDKAIADTIVWIMRRDNPKIAHNAILVDAQDAAFRTQVEQILAEAGNPERTVHADAAHLTRLLKRMLDPKERERLEVFLGENPRGVRRGA
jgi:hypothetical protein